MNKTEEELIWELYLLEGEKRDMKIVKKIEQGKKLNVTLGELRAYIYFKNRKEGKERFIREPYKKCFKFLDRDKPQHVGMIHYDNKNSNVFDPRAVDQVRRMVHGLPPVPKAE